MTPESAIVQQTAPSAPISIFIAGRYAEALKISQAFCLEVGLCVSVTPTEYVFSGGAEVGVIVGLINYPRFPATLEARLGTALALAQRLLVGLSQGSATVQGPDTTIWLTRRGDGA